MVYLMERAGIYEVIWDMMIGDGMGSDGETG